MDVFSQATLTDAKSRFSAPRIETIHRIEILIEGETHYLCGTGVLSTDRSDALEYPKHEFEECEADYGYLVDQGYNASIETSQRIAR